MFANRHPRFIVIPLLVLVVLLTLTAASPMPSPLMTQKGHYKHAHLTITDAEFLGIATFPTGTIFADTEVGGLSSITYDYKKGVYYALSDDRSQTNPSRFYTLAIDLDDGSLDSGDVTFLNVTFLTDKNGDTFAPSAIDPEGIELGRRNQLLISTEGDADASPPIAPFVGRFTLLGRQKYLLPLPKKFIPNGGETFGVRDNLAFESLTATPFRRTLYTATENALAQDGPPSTLTDSSPSRVLEYKKFRWPGREFVYMVDPIPQAPIPAGSFADNGLVELQALDNRGTFLAMERSFAVGVGNTVRLFEVTAHGATDVSDYDDLTPHGKAPIPFVPMKKRLAFDVELDLGVSPDNLEGMIFGPPLPDGRLPLILVSDNNFNPNQITQFIAVAISLEPVYCD